MNGPEMFIPITFFICCFGVAYLYFSSKHRERMALIEKGENAGLFYPNTDSFWKMRSYSTLSFALTLMGIGAGIIVGSVLFSLTESEEMYPATIFLMAGLGLFISFRISKKAMQE